MSQNKKYRANRRDGNDKRRKIPKEAKKFVWNPQYFINILIYPPLTLAKCGIIKYKSNP